MLLRILRPCCWIVLGLAACGPAWARTAEARIARVTTPVATLEGVQVQLAWPADAAQGQLTMHMRQVRAADLGYRFRDLQWRCPLRRLPRSGWACDGVIDAPGASPLRLSVRLDDASTEASLARGASRLALQRSTDTPDLTRIDLTRVPVQWAAALAAQARPGGRFSQGRLDGRLAITTPRDGAVHVQGPLALAGGALQSDDGSIVGENLDAHLDIDYRTHEGSSQLALDGTLGGEALFGETYLGLAGQPVRLALRGETSPGQGWRFPLIEWRDGATLHAHGSARVGADNALAALDLTLDGGDAAGLRDRYLSALLGKFGMSDVEISGQWNGRIRLADGRLQQASATLHDVDLHDPRERFILRGLDGTVAFSAGASMASELRWRQARMYGLDFGETRLPFDSRDGALMLQENAVVPLFGGRTLIHDLRIVPPNDAAGLQMDFGLTLEAVDVGAMAKAFGLPAFRGELNGEIPHARYADDQLTFDGGLSLGVFDGAVQITRLAMERPFGTAPTLSADIDISDVDLLRLTEVFDFGSITGRLDGYIHGLRLVDWTPVRFDAAFATDRKPGVRQRISQRAVQNISSVGDASFVSSLQGQLIGLFDDFGYSRLGIRCQLNNEVCLMGGLGDLDTPRSDSSGFTIVEGAGLPRLTVVGYNRRVDWPTLVERMKAVGKGDVKPVID
ncbi:MAG: hypothetical protein IAE66_01165 [Xanthomonadaceae bacterium]|nr:hypothetical protein [Xanthomonadaceae bacterium]